MKKIYFVDDEENILKSLKRSFYKNKNEWDMRFLTSAEEALELLKTESVDIIVSDMKMPGMNGVNFFRNIQKYYPSVIRIALSGHAEQTLLIESIGLFHQYYTKPCDLNQLENGINEAFELYNILRSPKTRELINGSRSLPVIPDVYTELQRELSKPEASIADISKIIEQDISLTANILSLINTPFFGLRSSIKDLTQAISLLGIELIKSMILTINIFQKSEASIKDFSLLELMNHSVRVGNFCQEIAKYEGVSEKERDLFFITGVLHDIGKVIFYNNYESDYQELIKEISDEMQSVKHVEESHFKVNHAHVGAYLLGLWGFDKHIVHAVANHHGFIMDNKNVSLLLQVLYCANVLDHKHVIIKDSNYTREVNLNFLSELEITDKYEEWEKVVQEYIESQL